MSRKNESSPKVAMLATMKIISMYAKGMTISDIELHMQDLYGMEISDSTISRITDKILPNSLSAANQV